MVTIRTGNRIAQDARLRVSCAAAVFDNEGKVLVTKREDDGHWCFPGGGMEPGESVTEACEREVLEETGLVVRVDKLIAIYSSPHSVSEYPDGNRWHCVDLLFQATVAGGQLRVSEETMEAKFCTQAEIGTLELHEQDRERVEHVFAKRPEAVVR